MSEFPRTTVEDVSLPRMLIGTNWFLGFSHQTQARTALIKQRMDRPHIAEVLDVFMGAGIDAIYGVHPKSPHLDEAIADAEQRSGRRMIRIGTPNLDLSGTPTADDYNRRELDAFAAIGCTFCMPHQGTTDALCDRRTRTIRDMDRIAAEIRARDMIPGLSTHMPEVPVYADETGLDVATYIQIYNPAGFLMQIEIDWVQRMIWNRAKPVICIKPLAAGRVQPLVGLSFVWSTIRDGDMVCVGTFSPDEAREVIEISCALFERRVPDFQLQRTRSKASLLEAT